MDSSSDGEVAWTRAHVATAGHATKTTPGHPISKTFSAGSTSSRLSGIDAARGIAMVMVCASHVRHHFVQIPAVFDVLTVITRIATPTFLLLSGFVAAHVLSSARNGVRLSLIDRGLFVLIAGHLLLNIEELPQVGLETWLLARVTVTDAIGICLIIGALCSKLSTRALLIAGSTLAVVSWPIAVSANTDSNVGNYLLIALFDARSGHSDLVDAAIAPYLGLFLIGMGLSKSSSDLIKSGNYPRLARKLLIVGVLSAACVVAAALLWRELKDIVVSLLATNWVALMQQALNPMQKLPPSPGYLMFYGGAALAMASVCLGLRPRVLVEPIVRWAATFGRASLMCFVVQDWLLRGIPILFDFDGFDNMAFWVAYFVATIVVLHWLATQWDARRGNRFLSVGLKAHSASTSPTIDDGTRRSRPA